MNRKDRKQKKKKERQERLRQQKHVRHFGEPLVETWEDVPPDEEGSDEPPGSDEQTRRIDAILGESLDRDFEEQRAAFFRHLQQALVLPCEVTGSEDFRWDEYYIFGPGGRAEHGRLRRYQPSYMDRYELTGIELDEESEWMLFAGDDVAAHVRRLSDNQEFVLGLAELKAVDRRSPNYQLLDDFGVFVVNNR